MIKRPPVTYRPRKGDLLYVLARTRFDVTKEDQFVHIELVASKHTRTTVQLDDIAGVHSYGFKVGDPVRNVNRYSDVGTIRALADGMAWVKLRTGPYVSYAASEVEPDPDQRRPPMFDEVEEPASPAATEAAS